VEYFAFAVHWSAPQPQGPHERTGGRAEKVNVSHNHGPFAIQSRFFFGSGAAEVVGALYPESQCVGCGISQGASAGGNLGEYSRQPSIPNWGITICGRPRIFGNLHVAMVLINFRRMGVDVESEGKQDP